MHSRVISLRGFVLAIVALLVGVSLGAIAGRVTLGATGGQNPDRGQASPASVPIPKTATPQSYPPAQVQAGQKIFSAQCGFCHGRDAMGGESGPDLTRAAIAA